MISPLSVDVYKRQEMESIIGALNALILNRLVTRVNTGQGKNIPVSLSLIHICAGLLYTNGLDVTLAYEHEMNYRHAWEFFANGYLQWAECESCKHVLSLIHICYLQP